MSAVPQISTFDRLKTFANANESSGRPVSDLCSEETAAKILKYLAQGNYLMPSCEAAGVQYHTVRSWIRKAQEARERGDLESPYVKFAQALTHAEAAAETALVERLNTAEDWRAQSFILERRHRERWGKTEQQQQPSQVLIISDELAKGMLEALQAAAAVTAEPGQISNVMLTNPDSEKTNRSTPDAVQQSAAVDAEFQQLPDKD